VTALLLRSLLVIVAWLVLRGLVRWLILPRIENVTLRYSVTKTAGYVLGFLLGVALLSIWLGDIVELSTFLGLVSAGLAIALHEPVTNLAGWAFLVIRKPFRVGDRIELDGGPAGDVIDQRLFMFSILEIGNWVDADQSTGRIIHIPNGVVFRRTIANSTHGFRYIWNELAVTVTFESDWERGYEILSELAHEAASEIGEEAREEVARTARRYMIFYEKLTPIVWVSVADNGVTLTVRYLCEARRRRSSASKLWSGILRAFAAETDIDFAYPTTRFYQNPQEGKPGTGGPG
jgi:small-conductance mechanosensitive channel